MKGGSVGRKEGGENLLHEIRPWMPHGCLPDHSFFGTTLEHRACCGASTPW